MNLASYADVLSGSLDDAGQRRSIFLPLPDGTPRLVAVLLARQRELAGQPVPGLRGMPLAYLRYRMSRSSWSSRGLLRGRPQ